MKLLILSDIHGNWPALEAVLQANPDFDTVAFCGDVVDYGPCPVECLRWVAEHADYVVRGNHDNALGFDLDCRCMGSFREYSLATRAWHRTLLNDAEFEVLRNMFTLNCFEWGGKQFRMAHATPHGDLFEYLSEDQWEENIKDIDADYVLLGHTHIQGMRTFGGVTVVNPGSVGLARDGGGGEACYAILQDGQVNLQRILYNVNRTVALLEKAPLPSSVINGLASALRGKRPIISNSTE